MRKNQKQKTSSKRKISIGISKLIARRKAEGKSWGAPKGYQDLEQKKALIEELLYRGYTQRHTARIIGQETQRLERYIQSRQIKPKQSHKTLAELIKSANLPLPDKKKYQK